jgi:serum amyloid A protein
VGGEEGVRSGAISGIRFITCFSSLIFSHAKNYLQGLLSQYYPASCNHDLENLESNQRAEEWGRSGKSPDHFRPPDLPEKF